MASKVHPMLILVLFFVESPDFASAIGTASGQKSSILV
jgi:hypothetical protein